MSDSTLSLEQTKQRLFSAIEKLMAAKESVKQDGSCGDTEMLMIANVMLQCADCLCIIASACKKPLPANTDDAQALAEVVRQAGAYIAMVERFSNS